MLFRRFLTAPCAHTLVFVVEHQLHMKGLGMRGAFFTEYLIRRHAAKPAQSLGLEYPLVIPVWHGIDALFYGRAEAAPKYLLGLQESTIEIDGGKHSFQGRG